MDASRQKSKTYPSHVLTDALRDKNVTAQLMWEIPGPKDTQIAWLSCYLIGSCLCVVQTFQGGDGWLALTSNGENNTDAAIADVVARSGFAGYKIVPIVSAPMSEAEMIAVYKASKERT